MASTLELIARTIGQHESPPEILGAAAQVARRVLGTDSTFLAVADPSGAYPMSITDGIADPAFREITIRPGTGLGGQVLLRGRPHRVADYLHDPTISRDFVHVVCELEGLRGMACVPVPGKDRIEALLYASTRAAGAPPDQTLRTLELVATQAELSLHQAAVRKQETELALLFTIGAAARYAREQNDPAALSAALEEIEATAAQARSELRATLHQLAEPAGGLAFEARLSGEARLFERTTGCRIKITGRGERRDLPQPVEDLLIDTAIEGLRNAVKHAHAQVAILHLAYGQESVVFVLQAGMQPLPPANSGSAHYLSTGTGLVLLRQRASQLRGELQLTCDSTGHTVLRIEVPTRLRAVSQP
jgi:GAF domain-containing protein